MISLPMINEIPKSRTVIDAFGGYNHGLRIGEGEFYDEKNLAADHYPVLTTRKKRGIYASPAAPSGLISKDALCYCDGSEFVINEYRIDMGLSSEPKTLISMGAYVIIMPDKKYINTQDHTDRGDIEATYAAAGKVDFTLCKENGDGYGDITVSSDEPAAPANLALWIDKSSSPHTLKQYSASSGVWATVATTYIKISAKGIGKDFEAGDGVKISGVVASALSDLNSTMVINAKDDDYIVVTGILDEVAMQNGGLLVERRMPAMDFITESENRLWGCRYGISNDGAVVNEIYASKLGDFKNFYCFEGISTDSYAVTLGSDGQFTGACTHLGYPIFFKENCMHKIYGNYPASYQVQTTSCRGVQRGCERSIATVNEILYYKSRSGVCAYDGSLPFEISGAFGNISYSDARAGAHKNKYYISMADPDGVYRLFVYDTEKGIWHKEDEIKAEGFCACRGDLYFIDAADKKIKLTDGEGFNFEDGDIEWMCESGIIGIGSPDKKYLSRIDVRIALDIGGDARFYVEYDSSGTFEQVRTFFGNSLRSFSAPIRPRRCDHLRIRIEGRGNAKIFSLTKTFEEGSDTE